RGEHCFPVRLAAHQHGNPGLGYRRPLRQKGMSSSAAVAGFAGLATSSAPAGGAPYSSEPLRGLPRKPPAAAGSRAPKKTTLLSMICVVQFLRFSLSVHSRVCKRPSTKHWRPFARYSPHSSASFPHTTIRCHSVRSCFWPLLSVQDSLVAMRKFATAWPPGVNRTSGSAPRLPIKIALLTPPAIRACLSLDDRSVADRLRVSADELSSRWCAAIPASPDSLAGEPIARPPVSFSRRGGFPAWPPPGQPWGPAG